MFLITHNSHVLKLFNLMKHTTYYYIRTANLWVIPSFQTSYCNQSAFHNLAIVLNTLKQSILPETNFNKSLMIPFFY